MLVAKEREREEIKGQERPCNKIHTRHAATDPSKCRLRKVWTATALTKQNQNKQEPLALFVRDLALGSKVANSAFKHNKHIHMRD